jgi:AcrR family transcriptional regulator
VGVSPACATRSGSVTSVTAITLVMTAAAVKAYHRVMARWEPNARGRLEQAAMELYAQRGFEVTTVAEIAERAGLSERTFFRHFADKREVLFQGAGSLQEFLVRGVDEAPRSLGALDAVVVALMAAATDIFQDRREFARRRQAIIAANAELHERELIKLATLASALADALRRRGVSEPAATLAAEAGISLFKISFGRWVEDGCELTLSSIIEQSLDDMRLVTGGRGRARRR